MFKQLFKKTTIGVSLTTILLAATTHLALAAWGPSTVPHNGITNSQYEYGYRGAEDPVVTFNSYKDFKAEFYEDPYDKNSKVIYNGPVDEREFLWVTKKNRQLSTDTFNDLNFSNPDEISLNSIQDGDILTFWVYIHNNAAPGVNERNNKNGTAIAKDVKLKIDLGDATKTTFKPKAYIESSNATPTQVWSDARINLPSNLTDEYELEFWDNHSAIFFDEPNQGWTPLGATKEKELFGNGTLLRSETDLNWGLFRGCSEHQTWLVFDVKVKKKPKPPKVCKDLTITPKPLPTGPKEEICATITGEYQGKLAWDLTGSGSLIGEDSSGGSVRSTVDTDKSNKSCITIGGVDNNTPTTLKVRSSEPACQDEATNDKSFCDALTVAINTEVVPSGTTKLANGNVEFAIQGNYQGNITAKIEDNKNKAYLFAGQNLQGKQISLPVNTDNINKALFNVKDLSDDSNATLTIEADGPHSQKCEFVATKKHTPEEKVCKEVSFIKRPSESNFVPGEYCVQAYPLGNYTGNMKWEIIGQGEFANANTGPAPINIYSDLTNGIAPTDNPNITIDAANLDQSTTSLVPDFKILPNNPSIITKPINGDTWCATVTGVGAGAKLKITPTDDKQPASCSREIENKTTPPPPPPDNVCKAMIFSKSPGSFTTGEYCVKASPEGTYTGPTKWKIDGTGAFNGTVNQNNPETIVNIQNGQWCANITSLSDTAKLSIVPTQSGIPTSCRADISKTKPPVTNVCQSISWSRSPNFNDNRTQTISVNARMTNGSNYTGDYTWTIRGEGIISDNNRKTITTSSSSIRVNGLKPGSAISVRATNDPNVNCRLSTGSTPPEKPPVEREPEISKRVKRAIDPNYSVRVTVPYTGAKDNPKYQQRAEIVEYEIIYDFTTNEPVDVRINDEIGDRGYLLGSKDGKIIFDRTQHVFVGNRDITNKLCRNAEELECIVGSADNLGTPGGLLVQGVDRTVTVVYSTIMNSVIDDDSCNSFERQQDCAERFFNKARGIMEIDRFEYPGTGRISNDTQVMVPCRFFLTRAGGDVFFEDEFDVGIDPQFCGRRSTTGIILKRRPETVRIVPKTGAAEVKNFSHKVCQLSGIKIEALKGLEGKSQDEQVAAIKALKPENLPDGFKDYINDIKNIPASYVDPVKNFSSLICEIQIATASDLNKDFIKASIEENVTRIARWNENLNTTDKINESTFDSIKDDVLRKKGTLTISSMELKKDIGARTIIVEDGDLIIEDNITYPNISSEVTDPREVTSLAFIVLGGDIIVDTDVTELSGVFFVQEKDGKGGQIKAPQDSEGKWEISTEQLQIFGQVFGDIKNLFNARHFSGDPIKDEGAITIYYDERIILNTPPGLEQIIDLNQLESV